MYEEMYQELPYTTKDVWLTHPQWEIVLEALNSDLTATKQKHAKVNRDLVRKNELQKRVYALEAIMKKVSEETLH